MGGGCCWWGARGLMGRCIEGERYGGGRGEGGGTEGGAVNGITLA